MKVSWLNHIGIRDGNFMINKTYPKNLRFFWISPVCASTTIINACGGGGSTGNTVGNTDSNVTSAPALAPAVVITPALTLDAWSNPPWGDHTSAFLHAGKSEKWLATQPVQFAL
jgi:hypothetical protein